MARIAVLDDYQRVAHRFADWSRLAEHEVTFFHEPLGDPAATLAPFEIVCAMRERTPVPGRSHRTAAEPAPAGHDRDAERRDRPRRGRAARCHGLRDRGARLADRRAGVGADPRGRAAHPAGGPRDAGRRLAVKPVGVGLGGKTLGIVGLGRLGSAVARIGAAFGMRLVAWSENLTAERARRVEAPSWSRRTSCCGAQTWSRSTLSSAIARAA